MTVWALIAEGPHDSFVLGVYDDFEKARQAKDSCYEYFEFVYPRSFTIFQLARCQLNELPSRQMLDQVIDLIKHPE